MEQTYSSNERDKKCVHNFGLEIPWKVVIWKAKPTLKANSVLTFVVGYFKYPGTRGLMAQF
jgi:hypothetical protein